jgi:hypothetical protein
MKLTYKINEFQKDTENKDNQIYKRNKYYTKELSNCNNEDTHL